MRRNYNIENNSFKNVDQYFYIKNQGQNTATIYLKRTGTSVSHITVQYATENPLIKPDTTWKDWTSTNDPGTPVPLSAGSTIYLKGNVTTFWSHSSALQWVGFDSDSESNEIHIGGNIMSLFNNDNFNDVVEFNSTYKGHCGGMFYGFKGLVSASQLIMPVQVLYSYSYAHMFQECRQLVYPPQIEMREIQASSACKYMFYNCRALKESPILYPLSHNGKTYCYTNMFQYCTSLKTITMYLITWGSNNGNVFSGTPGGGIFYMHRDATWTPTTYALTSGWTYLKVLE